MKIYKEIEEKDVVDFINEKIKIALENFLKEARDKSEYANSDSWGGQAIRIDELYELMREK